MKSPALRIQFYLFLVLWCLPAFAGRVNIQWEAIDGASQYELNILRDSKVVFQQVLPVATLSWTREMPFGVYAYRIRAIDGTQTGPWSDPQSFLVPPTPPDLYFPANGGTVLQSREGQSSLFKWALVTGVKKFAVEILQDGEVKVRKTVEANQTAISGLKAGTYSWRVQPILEVGGRNVASAGYQTMPQETRVAQFRVEVAAPSPSGAGTRLGISEALVPHTYQFFSPSSQTQGSNQALANQVGLTAEIPIDTSWALSAEAQISFFEVGGLTGLNQKGVALRAQRRFPLADDWSLAAQAGVQWRDYIEVTLDNSGGNSVPSVLQHLSTLGPEAGLGLHKPFSRNLSAGLTARYFLPLALLSAPAGSRISGGHSYRNIRLGMEASYQIDEAWTLGAGASYELRSLGFQLPGQASAEEVSMDGFVFLIGLAVTFL